MHRIIIADNSADFSQGLGGALRSRFLVEVCTDGPSTLELLRQRSADVLVLDLMIPGLDGMKLLEFVHQEQLASAVIVTSLFLSDYIAAALSRCGVDYAAIKPCSVSSLAERVEELCAGLDTEPEQPDPHCAVTSILLALGLRTNKKGFRYIRDSVLMLAREPGLQVTKNVYPDVGKAAGGNAQSVEKAIRTAIAAAWEQRDNDIWRRYFAPGPDGQVPRPTNSEFLTRLADIVAASERPLRHARRRA